MTEHVNEELLESYVMGAIGTYDRSQVEAHVVECERCAKRLADEARVELAMFAVAKDAERCPGCKHRCPEPRCQRCGAARIAGRYRIRSVVSQSPRGRVYLAEAPGGGPVALKEMVFTQVPDLESLDAFEREARVLKQLDHPSIPRYLDSFVDGADAEMRLYLAQTFVDGESLRARLESHRFTEAEARVIAWQVLEVLVYLQGLSPQVFHRDLKPNNVLMRADGSIAIVDFGAARERGATAHGTFAGTHGYAPPEQLLGRVDATSDPYALGMTLIRLLTREAPDRGMAKANISSELRAWLERLTARDPSARFPHAGAALVALSRPRGARVGARWLMLASMTATVVGIGVAFALVRPTGEVTTLPLPPPQPTRAWTPPQPTPPPRMGVVAIVTEPPGAFVAIDGTFMATESGERVRTPLRQISNIAYGRTHEVIIELEGYERYVGPLFMDGSRDGATLTVALKPLPRRPPMTRESVLALIKRVPDRQRRNELMVMLAESGIEQAPLQMIRDEALKALKELGCEVDPAGPPGFATIDTTPASELYWGEKLLGPTPVSKAKFPPGCVELTAKAPGRAAKQVKIRIESNRVQRFRFDL